MGICRQCEAPVLEGRTLCSVHMRDCTDRKHRAGVHVAYNFGSKLSPLRKENKIRFIQINNPYLRPVWKEVSNWIGENFELWSESTDMCLYEHYPLDMVREEVDAPILDAYYTRLGLQMSLEDFVIEKVDSERRPPI